jgi:type II secretory pathway component PulM
MEHLVRILNDEDRQAVAWLRNHVGDARVSAAARQLTVRQQQFAGASVKPYVSAVCRYLGAWPPARRRSTHTDADLKVGDQHLARIRQLLARGSTTTRRVT